jgi:hypothetical protein
MVRNEREPDNTVLLGTRRLLRAFAVLTLVAFVVLFVLTSTTDRHFAWTIDPHATAAFLGASYAAGCLLVILALRAGSWAALRIPYLTILVFAVLSLVATLLHVSRFHFGADSTTARFAAWLWLVVYIVVPVLMVIMLIAQERRPEDLVETTVPVPRPLAVALLAQGVVLSLLGALLYVVPTLERVLWPWPLTPLTARAVASWLVAFGLGAILAGRSNDLRRLEISAWSYGLMAVLQLIVVARHIGVIRWGALAPYGYLLLLLGVFATSVFGLRLARSDIPAPSRPMA